MKKLIAGNWKMNGGIDDARALIADVVNAFDGRRDVLEACDILVCPPFLHIASVRHALYNIDYIKFGAQDCSRFGNGAYTGDISAQMLADSECSYVILGHSERRQHFGDTDAIVAAKAALAHEQGLVTIICVGESDKEREQGKHEDIVGRQIAACIPKSANAANTVIAYEPVWAIGTGKTATPADIKAMHAFIRKSLTGKIRYPEDVRILYGGSMKPENAAAILATPNVDGGLIGGASLNAGQFLAIAQAALA